MKQRVQKTLASLLALTLTAQVAVIPVSADRSIQKEYATTPIEDDFGKIGSEITKAEFMSLMASWGTASSPYFSVTEGDLTRVKYVYTDSEGKAHEQYKTLSWSVPEYEGLSNSEIRQRYWLDPIKYAKGYTQEELKAAALGGNGNQGLTAFLWGDGTPGNRGRVGDIMAEYSSMVAEATDYMKNLEAVTKNVSYKSVQTSVAKLQAFIVLSDALAELPKNSSVYRFFDLSVTNLDTGNIASKLPTADVSMLTKVTGDMNLGILVRWLAKNYSLRLDQLNTDWTLFTDYETFCMSQQEVAKTLGTEFNMENAEQEYILHLIDLYGADEMLNKLRSCSDTLKELRNFKEMLKTTKVTIVDNKATGGGWQRTCTLWDLMYGHDEIKVYSPLSEKVLVMLTKDEDGNPTMSDEEAKKFLESHKATLTSLSDSTASDCGWDDKELEIGYVRTFISVYQNFYNHMNTITPKSSLLSETWRDPKDEDFKERVADEIKKYKEQIANNISDLDKKYLSMVASHAGYGDYPSPATVESNLKNYYASKKWDIDSITPKYIPEAKLSIYSYNKADGEVYTPEYTNVLRMSDEGEGKGNLLKDPNWGIGNSMSGNKYATIAYGHSSTEIGQSKLISGFTAWNVTQGAGASPKYKNMMYLEKPANFYMPGDFVTSVSLLWDDKDNGLDFSNVADMSHLYNADGTLKSSTHYMQYNAKYKALLDEMSSWDENNNGAQKAILMTAFDDFLDIASLTKMNNIWGSGSDDDTTSFLGTFEYKKSMMYSSDDFWDYNGTYEIQDKTLAVKRVGEYTDGTQYEYVDYEVAKDVYGNPVKVEAQYEITPWVAYNNLSNKEYKDDYVRNNGSVTNPKHASKHTLSSDEVENFSNTGLGTFNNNPEFNLVGVEINISRDDVYDTPSYSSAASVFKVTLTGDDMYNINLISYIDEYIKKAEQETVSELSKSSIYTAAREIAGYSEERADAVVDAYVSAVSHWNDKTQYSIEIQYIYEAECTPAKDIADMKIDSYSTNVLYTIPEYSLAEYYDSITEAFTPAQIESAFDSHPELGPTARAVGNTPDSFSTKPLKVKINGMTPVPWSTQLSRIPDRNASDAGEGRLVSVSNAASLSPGELYFSAKDGRYYAVTGVNKQSNKAVINLDYYVLSTTSTNVVLLGDEGNNLNLADAADYSKFDALMKNIAGNYEPIIPFVSSSRQVHAGNLTSFDTQLDRITTSGEYRSDLASSSGEHPVTGTYTEELLTFDSDTGLDVKVFVASRAAQDVMNSAKGVQRVYKLQRLLLPIRQYTVSPAQDVDSNFNNHLQLQKIAVAGDSTYPKAEQPALADGSNWVVTAQGTAQMGVREDAIRAAVSAKELPNLVWDAQGNVVNKKDGKLSQQFLIDMYIWLSKTTASDGIYIADWVNDSPVWFNKIDGTGKSLRETTAKTGGTGAPDIHQNVNGTQDNPMLSVFKTSRVDHAENPKSNPVEKPLNRAIVLTSTPTSGTFSDWIFGKTTGRVSEAYFCEHCQTIIHDISEHALDYLNVGYGFEATLNHVIATTQVLSSPNCGLATASTDKKSTKGSGFWLDAEKVVCSGPYHKVGFWLPEFDDPRAYEAMGQDYYIDLFDTNYSFGAKLTYTRVLKDPGVGSLDVKKTSNGIKVTGTEIRGNSTYEVTPNYAQFEADKAAARASALARMEHYKKKGALNANIQLSEVSTELSYVAYLTNFYVGGLQETSKGQYEGNRMGSGDILQEPYGRYFALPNSRVGGKSNRYQLDLTGGVATALKHNPFASLDLALFEDEAAAYASDPNSMYNKVKLDYENYQYLDNDMVGYSNVKNNRGGFILKNVNTVQALAVTKRGVSTGSSTMLAGMSASEKALYNRLLETHKVPDWVNKSFGSSGVEITTTPYHPTDMGTIELDMGDAIFDGTYDFNGTTVEYLDEKGIHWIEQISITEHSVNKDGDTVDDAPNCIHETSVKIGVKVVVKTMGLDEVIALRTATARFLATQPVISIYNDIENTTWMIEGYKNGSQKSMTVDNDYFERSGKFYASAAIAGSSSVDSGDVNTNVHTITVTTDNVTYNPMTFVANLRKQDATPESWEFKLTDSDKKFNEVYADGEDNNVLKNLGKTWLEEYNWQADNVEDSRIYHVVPEVLMLYKTDYTNNGTIPWQNTTEDRIMRGRWGHVYVAGYNQYDMAFPTYNNVRIEYDVDAENIDFSYAAVAKDRNATALTTQVPVLYTGSEAAVQYTTKGKHEANWYSFALDFQDEKIGKAWNTNYAKTDSDKVVQDYLNKFTTADTSEFEIVTRMTNTFGMSITDSATNKPVASATAGDLVTETAVTVVGENNNTKYVELANVPITIRNGKLAAVNFAGKLYKFNVSNIKTSEDLKNDNGFKSLMTATDVIKEGNLEVTGFDVAEAIYNMKLVEFAGTWVSHGGSETWNKYSQQPIGSAYTDEFSSDYEEMTAADYVASIRDIDSVGYIAKDNRWYGEDSTTLCIRIYRQRAVLPSTLMFSWKIPASYGYKAPTSKAKLFDTSEGQPIYGFCELAFRFANTPETEKSVSGTNTKVNAASFDIWGNAYTGHYNHAKDEEVKAQFAIHNASVNDMR